MAPLQRLSLPISALLLTGLLAGCGGGGGGAAATPVTTPTTTADGNTAAEGFNWFNTRREQIGLAKLGRNTVMDKAAQNHSDYQATNNTITHVEVAGLSGFTGAEQMDRLRYVNYSIVQPYGFGEVISLMGNSSGATMAEELITAIYHRFAIFEPRYKEGGSGAAISRSGQVYFTTNMGASNGYGAGIGRGKLVSYPFAGQIGVVPGFLSDTEVPDPFPDKNEVGYPVSVHADLNSTLEVSAFTIRRQGATVDLPARLLSAATDPETLKAGPAAAAIVPNDRLLSATTYDVTFTGRVDSVDVTRKWSFTTK